MPAIKQTTTSIELEATTVILDGNVQTDGTIQIPAASSIDVAGAGATSLYASAGANNITIGGATSTVLMPGNLTVSGTTTFIDTTNLRVEDKTIDLNSDSSGTGVATNDGAGLNILSINAPNTITFTAVSDGGPLRSSSGLSVATGTGYDVAGTSVLTATTLGSTVVNSSLTSVGTIATGTWNGTVIGSAYGGTGQDFSGSTGFIQFTAGTAAVISAIDLTADVTGTLPIGNGGTGSTTFTANSVVLADPAGNALVDSGALTNGQLLIGSTGAPPTPATLTAGSGISITNAAGAITITNTGGGFTGTAAYSAGVGTNVQISLPSGSSDTVGFSAQILMEDDTAGNSGLVEISGIVTRSTGAPFAPTFDLIVVPGSDADKVSIGTGGADTLQIDIAAPTGTGDAYVNVTFVSG